MCGPAWTRKATVPPGGQNGLGYSSAGNISGLRRIEQDSSEKETRNPVRTEDRGQWRARSVGRPPSVGQPGSGKGFVRSRPGALGAFPESFWTDHLKNDGHRGMTQTGG